MSSIGIDLGRTNSRVAHSKDGDVYVFPFGGGYFTPPNLKVDASKPSISDLLKVIHGSADQNLRDKCKNKNPETLLGDYFKLVKQSVEDDTTMNLNVESAVITIPVEFHQSCKEAINKAAAIAKLEVSRIIPQPIAVVQAQKLTMPEENDMFIMVVDIGTKLTGISALKIKSRGDLEILEHTTKDFGGESFDDAITKFCCKKGGLNFEELETKNKIRVIKKSIQAKIDLSRKEDTSFHVLNVYKGAELRVNLTSDEFEECSKNIAKALIKLVKEFLERPKLNKKKLNKLVLSGNTTKIRIIQKCMEEEFPGKIQNAMIIDSAQWAVYGGASMASVIERCLDKKIAIGIDLGTTNSCVAVVEGTIPRMISNNKSRNVTPSIVYYTENGCEVGDDAKDQIVYNIESTIFDAKRMIGRNLNDSFVKKFIPYWPFKLSMENGGLKITIKVNNQDKSFSPEEVSSKVLETMKKYAVEDLGKEVTDAVISVPAYFNNEQRSATIAAAKLAGLNVLQIVTEPVAAGFAYQLRNKNINGSKALIFDLGGGTFDVTVVAFRNGQLRVLAVQGDNALGGEDIDKMLLDYCIQIFKKKNKVDLLSVTTKEGKMNLRRLKNACENAKIRLSEKNKDSTTVNVNHIWNEKSLEVKIERSLLESLFEDIKYDLIEVVKKCIQESKLTIDEIDLVILVGGSSKMPVVRNEMIKLFSYDKVVQIRNPEESVAMGAAVLADMHFRDTIMTRYLLEVTSHSLGVEINEEDMHIIIPKNSTIPCENMKTFTTAEDNQSFIILRVFEGDDAITKNNESLGEYRFEGIPVKPKGEVSIEVSFSLDNNKILVIRAKEKETQKNVKFTVDATRKYSA